MLYISPSLSPLFHLLYLPRLPPSAIIPARGSQPQFSPLPQETGISEFTRLETMWCQWSASYRLGEDPLRSAQHEYRFPMVIQLDEVVPPPPSTHKALLSPVQSSSQSYDYYSSSEEYEEIEDEEEEEEATESYCSSDLLGPGSGTGDPERASAVASAPVEQTVRMSRVLAWRNSFDSVFAEDNTGMFHLFPSLYPFLATRHIPTSGNFGFVG